MILTKTMSTKRHYVNHNYHDHAMDQDVDVVSDDMESSEDEEESSSASSQRQQERPGKKKKRRGPRGGVAVPFPNKLHTMLSEADGDGGHAHIVSWQPHGRCFLLHKPKEFVAEVMPVYFRQSKLTSFQRQLNLYGFSRLTSGPDRGAYYHELFLRGKEFLCKKMVRTRIKGTGFKAASSPETEPNFYYMPPLPDTPDCCGKPNVKDDITKAKTTRLHGIIHKERNKDKVKNTKHTPSSGTPGDNTAHVVWPDPGDGGIISCPPDIGLLPPLGLVSSSSFEESPRPVPVTPSMSPQAAPDELLLPSEFMLNNISTPCLPPLGDDPKEEDKEEEQPHDHKDNDEMYFEGQRFHYLDSDFYEHLKQPIIPVLPCSSDMFLTESGDTIGLPLEGDDDDDDNMLPQDKQQHHDEGLVDMIMG